jgi:uncharacterized protein YecE (DUF72 family)
VEYIGISGWTYQGWRGVFYPKGLPQRLELPYAARMFNSIEINGTHYSLQRPPSFRAWRKAVPEDFVFSIKGSRYITHMKQLRGVEKPLANFFASGVLLLGKKLGPFLWQLPPRMKYDRDRIELFLRMLPATMRGAVRLARRREPWMKGRVSLPASTPDRRLRHCMEVRNSSFMVPEFFRLLRRYKVAFVVADTAGKFPYAEDLTSDFAYVRLHGAEELYVSGYTPRALDHWAERILLWRKSRQPKNARLVSTGRRAAIRDVYVYFDNDAKVKAPEDARGLRTRLERRLKMRHAWPKPETLMEELTA